VIELPGGALVDIPETVLEVGAVTVHEHKAPARLIERWKTKEVFRALQRSYLPEIREIENMLWLVWVSRFVDYAQDAQLDLLGRIVGELRQGRNDTNYRLRIKARVLINKSFGRVDDIALMLQTIETSAARIVEMAPASLRVDFDEPLQGNASLTEIAQLVRECRAAGVGASVVAPTSASLGLRWGDTGDVFRKFAVTPGVIASHLGDVGPFAMWVDASGVAEAEAGTRLFLHVCDESGLDYPDPTGWTLLGNRRLNGSGTARHKLWTRIHPGGANGVSLDKSSGGERVIGRMYAVTGPALDISSLGEAEGTGVNPTTFGAATRERSIVFTAFDSGGTLSEFIAGARTWRAIASATAGGAALGVGIHAHEAFRDTATLGTGTATNSDAGDWGTFTVNLGPETLAGLGYGLLADRRRA
jgi:hypothetical protein